MRVILPTFIIALLAFPAQAQETYRTPADAAPVPAKLADAQWLLGQWKGTGVEGRPAFESWIAASDKTWVGTFIQQAADGGIQFTEHLYLTQEAQTLTLRLKHFNADLTGWEEKDEMLTFRLAAAEPCALYFSGLTLRCDTAEGGKTGLLAAVQTNSGAELVFRYQRIAPPEETD